MKKIKFSKEYPKLWKQVMAKLIDVQNIYEDAISLDLKEYDTKAEDGSYYELPKGKLLQLTFIGEKRIPFCTIRRWTQEKEFYYSNSIGEMFEIERICKNQK